MLYFNKNGVNGVKPTILVKINIWKNWGQNSGLKNDNWSEKNDDDSRSEIKQLSLMPKDALKNFHFLCHWYDEVLWCMGCNVI